MDAKELMLGDYIYDLYGNKAIVRKLEDYNEHAKASGACIELVEGPEEGKTFCLYGQIEPIPLTPEIMEENGFEKIEGCVTAEAYILDKGEWGEANLIIRRFDFNESFVICTPKDQTARISIGYVHELQHALRLAGIKKEIVL